MGKLGNDILEKMRDSVEEIDHHDLNKTEIKDEIREWEESKILNRTLLILDHERGSVHAYSRPEKIKEIYAKTIQRTRQKEQHKHKQVLHGIRAEIYRAFIKRVGQVFKDLALPKLTDKLSSAFDLPEEEVEEKVEEALDEVLEDFNEEYKPNKLIERACEERDDIDQRTEADLEEVEIKLPDKGDPKWHLT